MNTLALNNLDEVIIRAGAVAAAMLAVFAMVKMTGSFMVKQLTKAIHTELGDKVDKVYENTMELRPNGGSTVADAVRRLEAGQMKIHAEQTRQGEQLRQHKESQDELRLVVMDHLADHRKV